MRLRARSRSLDFWTVLERLARAFVVLTLVAAPLVSGCYRAHLCGDGELCNGLDDDCDGLVDEDFLDEHGIHDTPAACGACGIVCDEVFPTAEETECVVDVPARSATCRIARCPDGFHLAGAGACEPDAPAGCLPCFDDGDCALRLPGAFCARMPGGDRRCLEACAEDASCAEGYVCGPSSGGPTGCVPETGVCDCTGDVVGMDLACTLDGGNGRLCAGVQRCDEGGLGPCEAVLDERCNDEDDDCDGDVDEGFRDEAGRYVLDLHHCGACDRPCAPPGPNMEAACLVDPSGMDGVRCATECLEGFVDVDGLAANGCECERFDGSGPPPAAGGDADCDGIPDDSDEFVFVTTTGSDGNPGTLARPLRTVQAGIALAAALGKTLLVAQGDYEGPIALAPGVSMFGGYRADFRDRDLALYPVVLEPASADPGAPVIVGRDIRVETRIEGFVVRGGDALRPSEGSTVIFLDRSGPELRLESIDVEAGRGAEGRRGDDSSENVGEIGLGSLADLVGIDGRNGQPGTNGGICRTAAGGAGGAKLCPTGDVGGGRGADAACPPTGCVNGSPCGNGGCTDFTVGGVCDYAAVLRAAVPNPSATSGRGAGAGAPGATTYNAPTSRGVCSFCDDNPTLPRSAEDGRDGSTGADGLGGAGCAGAERIDVASGRLAGGAGANATAGRDGAGGGGASSGSGYAVIGGTAGFCNDQAGGSGGGGGSGGCGAPRAEGGEGGGASIGVVVRLASANGPTLTEVRVVTASGGRGGAGGIGAEGGRGGTGSSGGLATFWCSRNGGRGGDGGSGGAAGGGGGGCGGSTAGVLIVASPAIDPSGYAGAVDAAVEIDLAGASGRAGRGGFSPASPGTAGRDGLRDAVRVFVAP